MKKANLIINHTEFEGAVNRYKGFMEKCIGAQRVIKDTYEKRDLAESILLRLCALWESFSNDHLIDCVNKHPNRLKEFFGFASPEHPSWKLCEAILIGDRYRNFRSFEEFKAFTKKVIPDPDNPFLKIKPERMKLIDEVYLMRNYIAHYSSSSKRKLKKMYKDRHGLSNFLEPGQFVLAHKAKRLWKYFEAFIHVSTDMRAEAK